MYESTRSSIERLADHVSVSTLLPLRNRLKKDNRYNYVSEVDQFNNAGREVIVNHQLQRLRQIVSSARADTEFYKERIRDADIHDVTSMSFEEFATIKPITKNDLREHKSAMISRQFVPNELKEIKSGGTTDAPVPVFLDTEAINRRESATAAFNKWFGFRPGQKIAYLWAATQDNPELKTWKAKVQNRFVDRRLFLPSILDDEIMESHWRRLKDFRPTLLQAFPTPLAEFAEFLLRSGRQLELNAISTTAEALDPHQRSKIREALGTDPFEWIGVREAGRVATQCEFRDGMHINCYGLYIEVVKNSSFVSDNTGDILITDLWNHAMPIIRYRVGDIGRIDTNICRCGSYLPRLTGILGRAADVFINSKGQKIPGILMTLNIHGDRDEIEQIQLIQHDIGKFEANVVPGDHFEISRSTTSLRDRLCNYIGESVELKVRIVDDISREPSGKVRVCKNVMQDAN